MPARERVRPIGLALSRRKAPPTMRVLLVEDNFIIALDLAGLVEEAGVEPLGPVASVEEALAELERGRVEAAILDINLGDEDALAVADELERRAIPFAFATGYSPDDVLPPERAAVPVLAKPYSAVEVRNVLDTLRTACARGRKAAGA